ncbi:hypothetical protein N9530_01690 [Ascidiaceihabitans sp.]|nr:hypothetical protein [Ascidiaceihabitans sp.]
MSNFHNPNDPRHKRLFELLRQKHVATHLGSTVKALKVRKVDHDELDEIKRIAARSLTRTH